MYVVNVVVIIVCMQEMCINSGSSSDHGIKQQTSEITLLKAELETLRTNYEQLFDVHSKCKGQTKFFDDQV